MVHSLHLTQYKNGQTQYMTAVMPIGNETEEQLAKRAEDQAEALEQKFGGFFEILDSEEVIKSGINYPRVANGALKISVVEFA